MTSTAFASSILREYPGMPTLFASVTARGFSRLVVDSVDETRGAAIVVTWVEDLCLRYPVDIRCLEMLHSSCMAPVDGSSRRPHVRALLRTIEPELAKIVARSGNAKTQGIGEEVLDGTISAYLLRLDGADPLTGEHSRAVSLWCRRIARRLGYDDVESRFAARCGLLHDVGKSRTPSDILNAPRQLTSEEWSVMRDHTVIGAAMLAELVALEPFRIAARSHHERLDGKGYPDAIDALTLPQSVRIVSVADSFNAMIGRRPYRLPMSPSGALEQLVKNKGTQFDPDVVDAMVQVVEGSTEDDMKPFEN